MRKIVKSAELHDHKISIVDHTIRICGEVDGREIYGINSLSGKWSFGSSTCMPSDIKLAAVYTRCLNELWDYYHTLTNNRK